MFAGFRLNLTGTCIDFSDYREEGERHLESQKADIKRDLKNFIINESDGQTINGTLLSSAWFPQVKADVFLSHSHQDLALAQGIAGWLNHKFGLNCFIDSNVWGYADELLDILNGRYSDRHSDGENGYVYNYRKCIAASKHVDVMLNIALQRMIDKTEAVFLLSTDNAVHRYGDATSDSTYSPWIYSEIVCSDIVRKKPLRDYRPEVWRQVNLNERFDAMESRTEEPLRIAYEVSTKHLMPLSEELMARWAMGQEAHPYRFPLDRLYMDTLGEDANALWYAYRDTNNYSLLYRG